MKNQEKILVLDFGGQYNQLIARRVRDNRVYAEILPYTVPLKKIEQGNYKGIIFTGGPNSVYDEASPHYTKDILSLGIPVLGICYGCFTTFFMKSAAAPATGSWMILSTALLNLSGSKSAIKRSFSASPAEWIPRLLRRCVLVPLASS